MLYSVEQVATIWQQTFAFLLVEQTNNVLTITLNRAEKKNALNPTLVSELAYALSYAHHTANVWVVVLAAKGSVFCAGADLKAFMQTDDSASTIPILAQQPIIGNLFRQLHKPCIARLHAPVYAGGLLLVAGCTHVVATPNVTFALPEVKRGIFPFQVMQSLVELMPARKVLDWCMRAQTLSTNEALSYGLVTHLAQNEDHLDTEIATLAADICQYSPSAIRMGLTAFDELRNIPAAEQHQYLSNMLMQTLQTEDAMEGIMAFQQKRDPQWKGK